MNTDAAAGETRIEHRYPQALAFVERHGAQAVVILHDLIRHAQERHGQLLVQASVRQIAGRLPFLSKDSVHRRLRQLQRAGVLRTPATRTTTTRTTSTASRFQAPTYLLDLTDTGISLIQASPTST